jgi:hypothetical protein
MQHAQVEQRHGHDHLRGHKAAARGHGRPEVEACPFCGGKDEVIPILYGMPTHAAFLKADRGEIYLGGCEMSPYAYYCKRDDREF